MKLLIPILFLFALTICLFGRDACGAGIGCDEAQKLYKKGKYYEIFGVSRDASETKIKKAFKKLTVKCHPDKDHGNPQAQDNFIAITKAYQTLSEPQDRAHFDQFGSSSSSTPDGSKFQQGKGPGSQYSFFGAGAGGGQQQRTFSSKDFEDMNQFVFKSFFNDRSAGSNPNGGKRPNPQQQHFTFSFSGDGDDDAAFEGLFGRMLNMNSQSSSSSRGENFARGMGEMHTVDLGSIFGDLMGPNNQQKMKRGSEGAFGSFGNMFPGGFPQNLHMGGSGSHRGGPGSSSGSSTNKNNNYSSKSSNIYKSSGKAKK